MKAVKFILISFLIILFSGCGIINKSKKKIITISEIDTIIKIKPHEETISEINISNLFNNDTLKIETERNEIKVFFEKSDYVLKKKDRVAIVNKEKEISIPIKYKETKITKENMIEKQKNSFLDNVKIIVFMFCVVLFFVAFVKYIKI